MSRATREDVAWLERLDALARGRESADRDDDVGRDESFERYRATVELLRTVERPRAPMGFAAGVRRRIRRRQRAHRVPLGPDERLARPPWEALLNVLLLVILVGVWFGTVPRADGPPLPVDPRALGRAYAQGGSAAGIAAAVLDTYGEVVVVPGSHSPIGVTYRVTLPRDHLGALRKELNLYPSIETRGPPLPAFEPGQVEIRVRATYR